VKRSKDLTIAKLLLICISLTLSCAFYNTFYNAGKYYRDALNKQKTNPTQAKTSFEKAIEKSALVISNYPRSKYTPKALFVIGVSYYYLGEYTKAISKFENLQLVFPRSEYINEANLYWAYCLVETKDYNGALEKLMVIKRPGNEKSISKSLYESALFKIAEIYLLRKDYESAITELSSFIKRYPKSDLYKDAILMLGDAQRAQKNYPQAIATYQQYLDKIKVKTINPKLDTSSERSQIILRLAECYIESNRQDQGLKILDQITNADTLKSQPKLDSKSYLELGKLFLRLNNLEKARFYLNRIQGNQELAEAYYLLGNSYESEAQFDTAKAYYDSIVIKKLQSEYTALAQSRIALLSLVVEDENPKLPTQPKIIEKDSMEIKKDSFELYLDKDSTEIDTLPLSPDEELEIKPETLSTQNPKIDSSPPRDLAARQFHLAEIYNLNLKKYEQALVEYEKVYTQFPQSPFAPKALFAQAWIYKNILGANADTSSYYNDFQKVLNKIIVDYPDTEYAKAANEMLLEKQNQ
jgi:TolA-binding protein